MKRVIINIFGRVQGVGFRYNTLQKAREFNINGFVNNLRDGSVEIEAEGEEEDIDEFIEWCEKGPSYSNVKKVIVEDIKTTNANSDFEIF